jgi:hypothetical protein
MDKQTTIDRYLTYWNEPDANRRAAMIADIYAPDARQTGPFVDVSGYASIRGFADALLGHLEGHRFLQSGDVDVHHDVMRLPWTLVAPGGARVFARGTDFGTFDEDGRLRSISTFLDLFPEGVDRHHPETSGETDSQTD